MYFIFKQSDKTLLYLGFTDEQLAHEWDACLANEGGIASDYLIVQTDDAEVPEGSVPMLAGMDFVVFIPNPTIVARNNNTDGAIVKFRNLGFTDEEISQFVGR